VSISEIRNAVARQAPEAAASGAVGVGVGAEADEVGLAEGGAVAPGADDAAGWLPQAARIRPHGSASAAALPVREMLGCMNASFC
jgi:hypothetical protein